MIKEGKVVTIQYVLKSDAGEILDQSNPAEPFQYLHGYGEIVPGLEGALEGRSVGYQSKVLVLPSEGYGEIVPELIASVERSMFPGDAQLSVGMRFQAEVDQHPVLFTVEGIDGDKIKINGNHPLAGQSLNFDVEVLSVRDATEEELDHGHTHGPGSHHNH